MSSASQSPEDYSSFVVHVLLRFEKQIERGGDAIQVAEQIFRAANDCSDKIRYPVGFDAKVLLMIRQLFGDVRFLRLIKQMVMH